ncbi:MAG: hypothetical protein PHU85_03895 [Phycisphaerae bacterium]|nr:hypothetical protein [Phycisphaerae bacterium]
MNTGSQFGYACAFAVILSVGCAKPVPVAQPVPVVKPSLPSAERPIVVDFGQPGGLVFGGPDGTQRIMRRWPEDRGAYSLSSDGRMAAVLSTDGSVRFYDASGRDLMRLEVPGYESTPETRVSGTLWISSRGQAVVAMYRSRLALPVAGHVLRPDESPQPPKIECYYLDTTEKVLRLNVGPIIDVLFDSDGRFAVVVGMDQAAPIDRLGRWHVIWFDRPDRPAWRAEFSDRPWLHPAPGWAFWAYLPSHWPLHFRADGTSAVVRPDPAVFNKANAGYVERAGSFYEKEYLDKAADNLVARAGMAKAQRPAIREALRSLTYEYLAAYARESSYMLPEDFDVCIAALDRRMAAFLTEEQLARYRVWRDDGTNALAFLMHRPMDPSQPPLFAVTRLAPTSRPNR